MKKALKHFYVNKFGEVDSHKFFHSLVSCWVIFFGVYATFLHLIFGREIDWQGMIEFWGGVLLITTTSYTWKNTRRGNNDSSPGL